MIDQLARDGFVRFPGLLAEDVMADLADLAAQTLEGQSESMRAGVISNGSMCNIAGRPDYASLIGHPAVLDAITTCGGEDIRWTGGYLISKPPGGPPLFWHQDWWGWDSEISYDTSPAQVFVMVYLSDTSRENGCLRVIPGSHRQRHDLHDIAEAHSSRLAGFENAEDPAFASHPDEIAIPVRTGDVLIGDSRLIHGAYANQTGRERPLITLWYAPNYRRLPEAIRAHYARAIRDQVGDIADDSPGPLPFDWTGRAAEAVRGLLPDYSGRVSPQAWNREPDLSRLKA